MPNANANANTKTGIDGNTAPPSMETVLGWLSAQGDEQDRLYAQADAVRRERKGDRVPIRGIVEFSNRCARNCHYCGIRAGNPNVRRYDMTFDEILAVAGELTQQGWRTLVLQSGELPDPARDLALADLIARVKRETDLAVTLSVGERPEEVYRLWRDHGLDRYLLRFETADPALYARFHPGADLEKRLDCLRSLKALGIQTGGGFLIGLPGETPETVAGNILLCRELDLDMIGVGPFIPAPDTPLANAVNPWRTADGEFFFRTVAALRLVNPDANIPATTAFDALFPGTGRDRALCCGANVFMPNHTPAAHADSYQLYPGKPGLRETGAHGAERVRARLAALGRAPE